MAKIATTGGGGGRLTKIKSALKRWPSITKLARTNSNHDNLKPPSAVPCGGGDLRPVYVGRSRRLYLVGPEVIEHPVFQELLHRSGGGDEDFSSPPAAAERDGSVAVACEVVLFEHLLWMLENAESHHLESSSMDELADFYTC